MTITLHFQSTGVVPGDGKPFVMVGQSISVGRSDANDLVLPDPEKAISGRHCSIEDQGSNIVVIDLSTNGTFLNYGKLPLGRTETPLNDGDILSIGPYEIIVDVRTAQTGDLMVDIAAPIDAAPVSHGNAAAGSGVMDILDGSGSGEKDFLDDLLGDENLTGPSSVQREVLGDDGLMPPLGMDDSDLMEPLHDPNEGLGANHSSHSSALEDHFTTPKPATSSIPDDWNMGLDLDIGIPEPEVTPEPVGAGAPAFISDDLEDFSGGDAVENVVVEEAAPEPNPEPVAASVAKQTVIKETVESKDGSRVAQQASRAFLEAAGVANVDVSNDDLIETMARLGNTFRIMTEGMREILMTRTSIKSEFRINQTVISSGNNNPLKFSVSPQIAMETMVKPAQTGFLESDAAAEQALNDIKAHEVAVMTGMEAAIKGILGQLSPEELEKTIVESGGITSFLKNKKAQYWDVFEKQYSRIADQAESDFHEVFAKEFARAYQEQLERLK
ncbi:MAG: type VI secretion system-associated FHA domain protein TagH [Amylibacter sp.]|jgi:type VI secretion system protein